MTAFLFEGIVCGFVFPGAKIALFANSLFAIALVYLYFARNSTSRPRNTFAVVKNHAMKKILITLSLIAASILSYAQEPGNNLGKSLYQIRQDFPDAVNSGPADGGGDLWIALDEDQYHKYTYYFVIKNGRVDTETLGVSSTGLIPNAEYFFFITTVKSFYTKGHWQFCDVDASILRAASVFNSEHRLVWADKFSAEIDYSNFLVYFQYKPDSKVSYVSYFKR